MQRTKSKILSILLSLVMLLSLVPAMGVTALAAYPTYVNVYNGNGTITSLSDGLCLATNDATSATKYTAGSPDYVARYEASSGTLYLNGYRNDDQTITPSSVIYADGDLNIEVVSDSSFSTSVPATSDLRGIQANGKLKISGTGKLTVTANGDGDVYGICANEGVTISAPLNVQVGKVDSSKNGPLYGIYTKSGAISLSGNDMTVTATDAKETVYGVYNAAITSAIENNGNITISGNLTVNLSKGDNRGISSQGGVITLEGATVKIPGNYRYGIFNRNGNVVITSKSDVDISSNISNNNGICTFIGGNLTIQNSAVKVSAKGPAAFLEGNVSIEDSTVDLTRTSNDNLVIKTSDIATNEIDLSGSGSGPVTLTAPGNQEYAMINGKVTLVGNTICGMGKPDNDSYDGKYDTVNNITVLKFVHKDPASTTNISVSGTIKSYGSASDAVTVTLTKQGATTAFTAPLTGASGSAPYSQDYSFSAVPAGTYTLKVEKKGHAPWTENITVGTDNITGKDVTIYLIGDVNGDGNIDANDMQRIYAHISSENVFSDLAQGDVNGDDKVDANDMQRIYAHISGENPLS